MSELVVEVREPARLPRMPMEEVAIDEHGDPRSRNTISGFPNSVATFFLNRSPRRCNSLLSISSGFVSVLRTADMMREVTAGSRLVMPYLLKGPALESHPPAFARHHAFAP